MDFLKKYFSKKPTDPKIVIGNNLKDDIFMTTLRLESELYRKYDLEPYIDWVNSENDPKKLAIAYCVLNTWGWPEFMPPPPFDNKLRGIWDSPEGRLGGILMKLCESKAEKLHPGLKQVVWMSGSYSKYDLCRQSPDSSIELQNPEGCDTTKDASSN